MLDCWKGYIRKVLVLIGFGLRFFVLCFVVIVYYYDFDSCCCYEFFRNEFNDFDMNWEVIDCLEVFRSFLC